MVGLRTSLVHPPAVQLVVTEVTTPSGIEIRYTTEPKRKYEVRHFTQVTRDLVEDWFEVPSVTTVLDVLHKPLQWWGQEVGIAGVLELIRVGELRWVDV